MNINRWTPYKFNNGKTAKNRVVVPPMASQTADACGYATENTIQHYQSLSESGAGIVFAEYSYIHPTGRGEPNQLGVDSDTKVASLKRIARAIQQSGALAGLQLVHVGGKSSTALTSTDLLGPSSIAVPIKDHKLEVPVAMDKEQIKKMTHWYVQAAQRAHQAGFDIVEMHAAHGYGLNQWLSPITNQRNDEYGGSILGRSKMLFDIVAEIKQKIPDVLIAVRMPVQDHFPGGLQVKEMAWVAKKLSNRGVNILDISSGIGGWRRPKGIRGQGYLVKDATKIKQSITQPVIGVGGIVDGEFIDSLLSQSKIDFAAVGRAILENPHKWRETHLENINYADCAI